MPTLGVVTIGQAPRTDITPELVPHLPGVRLVEHGALDDLGHSEIGGLAPQPGDEVLATRLRDGTGVRVAHGNLLDRLSTAVGRCETDGADAVLLVCTGKFTSIPHRRPLLGAERLFSHGAAALADQLPVGVICPEQDQATGMAARWAQVLGRPPVAVQPASPYQPDAAVHVAAAAARLTRAGAELVLLDCMGYSDSMRMAARDAVDSPALLARTVVARLAGALVS